MGKTLARWAIALSLLFFIPFVPFIGVILGIIALVQAKKDPEISKGLSIAAIIIGIIAGIISLYVLGLLLVGVVWGTTSGLVERGIADADTMSNDFNLQSQAIASKDLSLCYEIVTPEIRNGCIEQVQAA